VPGVLAALEGERRPLRLGPHAQGEVPHLRRPERSRVLDALDPEYYVIENVATCDDLRDPARVNGQAFGLPIENERHFETNFPVPDALGSGRPEFVIGRGYDHHDLAAAKGVPASWAESEVTSAIPREFVQYVLSYCPAFPEIPAPETQKQPRQTTLAEHKNGLATTFYAEVSR
jgi:hypothetical protein